ncbi:MAG: hypothetical protein OEV68_10585 [candidate division Zixibacteria bacterium]|nr:hypothetical protein [candidate division Zixibacteria bacterium]
MDLENVDLAVALAMIAEQNNLNIVVGGDVTGQVSLRLVEVDLKSALDAILAPGGFNYYVRNDVLVVKPQATKAAGELVSKSVTLKYLDPYSVKSIVESRLSDRGKLLIIGAPVEGETQKEGISPNRIVITDFPAVLEEVLALIGELDLPQQMISIEVKIIESTIDSESKLGFTWPTSLTTTLGAGTQSISESSESGGSSESNQTELENVAGSLNPESGRWTWGTLTVDQLTAVLDLLNREGNSKLISDPHITTLENREAYIKAQTVIPIATISRFTEGAATQDIQTFYDEEVGISLSVTPRINEGNRITLDVHPQVEDIIGFSGPANNQKPITSSRSLKTTVTVNEGETIALGGLLKENEIEQVQKVPLLGRIPLLGKLLFTNKSVEKSTTDLIILITPRIMR